MTLPVDLVALADAFGVATEFTDWRGRTVEVSTETVVAVLSAMDVDATVPSEALARHAEQRWRHMLPACVVARQGEPRTFAVHVPHGDPVEVTISLEDGGQRRATQLDRWVDPREIEGRLVGEATFEVPPDLPLGYHTLHARSGDVEGAATLIVSPAWLGHARSARGPTRLGVRGAALQRPLARVVGCRRPHRPHRPRGVVGRRPRRRLPAGEPAAPRRARRRRWSRRPTCRRRERSSTRSTCGSSRCPSTPTSSPLPAPGSTTWPSRPARTPATSSTATPCGPRSVRRCGSCTTCRAVPAASRSCARSAPGTRRRCATSPRGACSPSTTAATLARGPTD